MTTIQALDNNTIQHINSGQVITTIDVIIKELLENSLDAGANNIDIKIVNGGLQLVEVYRENNGSGILLEDRPYIGKQHYTSKISKFEDLEKLSSFGFRGEALHALCVLAEVQITTKTKNDKVAICYQLDRNGDITSETPSGNISISGTIVSILKPFINIPVRRQIAEKTKVTTVNRIQDLVIKYSLSHPSVRLSLKQLQNTLGQTKTQPIWIKPTTKCLLDGVRMIYGRDLASMLEEVKYKSINVGESANEEHSDDDDDGDDMPTLKLNCLLPTKNSDPNLLFKNNNVFVYVNQRPINYFKSNLKELVAMVRQRYKHVLDLANDDSVKSPFMYIDIQSSQGSYDVNIEPDKSIAIFLNKQRILNTMEKLLDKFYGSFFNNTLSHRIEGTPLDNESHTPISPQSIVVDEEVNLMGDIGSDTNDIPKKMERIYYDQDTRDEVDELEPENDQLIDESPLFTMDLHENILSPDRNIIKHTTMDMDHADNHQHYHHNKNNVIQSRNAKVNDMDLDWQVEDTPEITHTSELIHTPKVNFTSTSHSVNDQSSNLLQPSWFDRFHRKQAGTNANTTTSVKRPSFHHRPELLPTSSDINQPKRLRVQSSIDDHLQHVMPASSLHSSHILNTITHLNEQNNDELIDHHHEQPTKTISPLLSPSTSSTIQQPLKNSSAYGNSLRRRDIESILKPSSPFSPLSSISNLNNNNNNNNNNSDDESLTCTLNNISIAKMPSTIEELTKNYRQFRHRYSYFYRKPLEEYYQQIKSYISSSPNNENLSYASRFIFSNDSPSTHDNNLGFITQNVDTDAGWLIKNIDAVDIIKLLQKHQFQKYMDDYILDCGNTLDHPVQLKISKDSCFYNIITTLSKQEQLDDTDHVYSEITDPRIISNGFHAQWRIEPQTNDLIIQITSLVDIKGYGLADFKELLALIQQNEYQHHKDVISLSKLRPSKVVDYFRKLAKENTNTAYLSKSSSSYESLLEKILPTYLDENRKNHDSKLSGSLVYTLL
ncbi:unnamed protein product [Cunninghamella echinulata]